MTLFAAMGVIITSAAAIVFPAYACADLWDPVKLVGQFSQPVVVAISMFTVIVADTRREHRRECRLTGERFCECVSKIHFV
jgi:cytosine/uracil/thiamine/allantoin permease